MERNERLVEALEGQGWSQKEAAVRLGVSESAMSCYVNGTRRPRIDRGFRLAALLGVSAGWLWAGSDAPIEDIGEGGGSGEETGEA